MPATQRVLFLWRNADTVVIGRAQNPWKECNTRRMEEDNVRWRGAVAVAAQCSTISAIPVLPLWLASRSTIKLSPRRLLNALNALGVSAEASGRNDLVVKTAEGDRKVSGSAYRETKDRGFHHGTLLLNSDLSRPQTISIRIKETGGERHYLSAFPRDQSDRIATGDHP